MIFLTRLEIGHDSIEVKMDMDLCDEVPIQNFEL